MRLWPHIIGLLLIALVSEISVLAAFGEKPVTPTVSRVEVVLAYHYRPREAELKQEFVQAGFPNVHFQFARMGQPPQNIGLGREVPADKAREAIRLALKYNLGIGILLPERLFPPRFITIASSNYDDTVEYPISQATLTRLQNPELTTEAFHRLYHELTSAVIIPKGRY
jgi:MoxR-like ATPase